jgi:hypothetical protein
LPSRTARAGDAGTDAAQAVRAQRFRSRQGEVWDEVDKTVDALAAYSPTRAMADSYEAGKDELERLMETFGPDSLMPAGDAVGSVVFWDAQFVCLDLLQPAKRFRQFYPKLLRGYAFEALMSAKLGGVGGQSGGNLGGGPSRWSGASRKRRGDFDPEAATLRLLAEALQAEVREQEGVDLGEDLRIETKHLSGAGLAWEREIIQLSVFPRKAV